MAIHAIEKSVKDNFQELEKYVVEKPVNATIYSLALKILGFTIISTIPLIGSLIGYSLVGVSVGIDYLIYKTWNQFKRNFIPQLKGHATNAYQSDAVKNIITKTVMATVAATTKPTTDVPKPAELD